MACRNTKWDFLEDDLELDEDREAARQEARELREQANALAHFAHGLEEPQGRQEKLCEAVSMYSRANSLLKPLAPEDHTLALQCRLNAACLAQEASAAPSGGQQQASAAPSGGQQQAEAMAARFAGEALELDAENPHAALLLARHAASHQNRQTAERWLLRAKSWAEARQEKAAEQQACKLLEQLQPSSDPEDPSRWLRQGTSLLKQGQTQQARALLEQGVSHLDMEEHGGPIEQLQGRAERAQAFDMLEALAEAFASLRDFAAALRAGSRAAALLEPCKPGAEAPFPEPDASRREGLLCLSLGHAAAAAEQDCLVHFRRAAKALQRRGVDDPTLQGTAFLELGLRLAEVEAASASDTDYQDAAEEACVVLDQAVERLRVARSRLQKAASPGSAKEDRKGRLAHRELRAQVALAKLHLSFASSADAEAALDSSAHLMEFAPQDSSMTSAELEWAELCGKWAFAAAKAGRLAQAEAALLQQKRLAGAKDPNWDDSLPEEEPASCSQDSLRTRALQLQKEALESLAMVRQRQGNSAGVEDAVSRLCYLAPRPEREAIRREVEQQLRRIGPPALPEEGPAGAEKLDSGPPHTSDACEGDKLRSSGVRPCALTCAVMVLVLSVLLAQVLGWY